MLCPGQGSSAIRRPANQPQKTSATWRGSSTTRSVADEHGGHRGVLLHGERDLRHEPVLDQGLEREDVPAAGRHPHEPATREHVRPGRGKRVRRRREGATYSTLRTVVRHRRGLTHHRHGDGEVDRAADEPLLDLVGVEPLDLQVRTRGGSRASAAMIGGRNVCSPIEVSPSASSPVKLAGSKASALAHRGVDLRERLVQRSEELRRARDVGTITWPSRRKRSSPNRSRSRASV